MSFLEATAVNGGPGRWSAEVAEGWGIFDITNGGYLMAIATRAMANESEGRDLISVTGTFANPLSPGPVDVDVETLKRGRSLTTTRATLSRDDRPSLFVTGVSADHDRPANPITLALGGPPDLPSPEDCYRAMPSEDGPLPPPFVGKIDSRIHPDDVAATYGQQDSDPVIRGWFRLLDDEPLDSHGVVQAADAFQPAIFTSNSALGWTPTVELNVQIRNPAPNGWMACRFATRFIGGGMLEEDGEIWDEEGRLVALSRQLALVPL